MYINIEHNTSNEGSFGVITEKDLSEILDILNLEKYMQREVTSEELKKSDLKEIISELENEADERFFQGNISQLGKFNYHDNCHSLARKMQEKRGWIRVFGYVFYKEDLAQTSIVLKSHSITRDESGTLVELTIRFPPDSYHFIEHETGQFGIDLIAYR
ncbi:hypothetical protein [Anabaena catenula]|uniref:Uncharacterized protein n=1 Tax=Anabaena catenula FACHB-362 TaxID=2692877 RepID=A0ABR8J1U2_9NOST|nr:hypothetical protein [Anabaena catenula]MBD2691578.1 hypothetical protein [Anabaena catenula FACHB-362]